MTRELRLLGWETTIRAMWHGESSVASPPRKKQGMKRKSQKRTGQTEKDRLRHKFAPQPREGPVKKKKVKDKKRRRRGVPPRGGSCVPLSKKELAILAHDVSQTTEERGKKKQKEKEKE